MFKKRRFMRLPADWEDLADEELERLCDRADRVRGMLPELPPLGHTADGHPRGLASLDDDGDATPFDSKRPGKGVDRETKLDQKDERGD